MKMNTIDEVIKLESILRHYYDEIPENIIIKSSDILSEAHDWFPQKDRNKFNSEGIKVVGISVIPD